jgi:hypothetical protein
VLQRAAVPVAGIDRVASIVSGAEAAAPPGRLRAVGRASLTRPGHQAKAPTGKGRERLGVVERGHRRYGRSASRRRPSDPEAVVAGTPAWGTATVVVGACGGCAAGGACRGAK